MRYILLLLLFITISFLSFSTLIEIETTKKPFSEAISEVYQDTPDVLFFLDSDSSFYHIYSFEADHSLFLRKVGHVIVFGSIALLLYLLTPIKRMWLRAFFAISAPVIIGIIDEVHQYFLIGRSGLFIDIVMNAIGSVLFTAAIFLVHLFTILYFSAGQVKQGKKQ